MTDVVLDAVTAEPDWLRCESCRELVYGRRYRRDLRICPHCRAHGRLTAPERIATLFDPGSVVDLPAVEVAEDPLGFAAQRPYPESLARARAQTGLPEAALCVRATIEGEPVYAVVLDFRFLGGSMGVAVGEAVTRTAEAALRDRLPLLLVTASGGARMQEGALSLMQMAKTSQALAALDEAGVLTITLVTDPTYGGVAASFTTLTDVVLAEPGAHLGFAGPRVIAQTTGQRLPEGFQTAEFLLARGLIDDVVPRVAVPGAIARLLRVAAPAPLEPDDPLALLPSAHQPSPWLMRIGKQSKEAEPAQVAEPAGAAERTAWEAVRLARHPDRPTTADYVSYLLTDFHELHGDRIGGDSRAVIAGLGRLGDLPIVLVGHDKGHRTTERTARNFGMASPAGYRKAARVMRLAAKLGLPVVTLIDTPGADPGPDSESNGQAVAIAENLRLMARLPVPVVCVVIGEGGSGGALAVGVGNRVLAAEHAVYSVISPEGCAAILWKDPAAAPDAATALRLTPRDLLGQGVIDAIVPEPPGGAHTDPIRAAELLGEAVERTLRELSTMSADELVTQRFNRFRALGGPAV
ncbi:acetyl-CoA carboxylase carboxyltransferase subunit alpha [Asanoa sp. WMMD1127]|uniref:acetyl-CoA carboxylase carboxyltransferase subunit alpha n=1 Tax=Asanoa sp. WMMD1127 TaxID=3016107 RepID=UPI0024165CB1|nr:acetyl-CoA carboxylase carboxyltransferase subunit alpha [Asanoa sp. WMMD1127]MDG4820771.1 acetyl-CoA carboxylase carboxyltransferase subunit alpha [Asanoa sp. WMMD1127]